MGYYRKMINRIQNNQPIGQNNSMLSIYHNNLLYNCLRSKCIDILPAFLTIIVIFFSLTACNGQGKTPEPSNTNSPRSNNPSQNDQDNSWMNAFDNGQPTSSANGQSTPANAPWTIVLATFGSENHQQLAEQFRANLTQSSGMTGFLITSRPDRSIIHYGHYLAPNSSQTKTDLNRIHAINIDGQTPFARAFPSVVQPSDQGAYPQFNLVKLWQQYPHASVIYSLQIGVYTFDNHNSETLARQTAEKAVTQLRAAGEQAFYYHGRTMSVVTVGAFFQNSVDPVTGASPEILQLQNKYPDNLVDGKQLIETKYLPGGKTKKTIQPSFLINVPKQ